MKVFSVDGYFDDDDTFEGYLIAEYDSTPDGYSDEDIFFYGVSEETLQRSIDKKEKIDDFTITRYNIFDDTQDRT